MIAPVDDRHIDLGTSKLVGNLDPAEARSDNDDVMSVFGGLCHDLISSLSAFQRRCVVCHMLANETGNEVVAVVVAWAQIQRERVPRLVAGLAQQIGLKLTLQELVAQTLIHQQRQTLLHGANQLHGVVLLPRLPVAAQVRLEGLVSPGTWVGATMGEKAETLR